MNYISLDMEWNQPFNMKSMVKKPVKLYGEIIQIGAVRLDENYNILDNFKIMISPKHYTKMFKKVSKLTGITTESLQYGFPFPIALAHFKKWCGKEFEFLTWGENDIDILRDNMRLHKIDEEWIPKAYNIQLIFDNQITKENRQVSLSSAMDEIGEAALEAHDALHDAMNTARICRHLDMEKGLAEYDAMKKQNDKADEEIKSEKTYPTKEAALTDCELVNFYSPERNENVVCVDFVRQNSDKFICIGKCENGDELFVRFKFKKQSDGKFAVSRILYEMEETKRNYYLEKQQKIKRASDYKESVG